MKHQKMGRTYDANPGYDFVIEQCEVLPVARGQVVDTGCDRGCEDWAILGSKCNAGGDETDIAVTDELGPRK